MLCGEARKAFADGRTCGVLRAAEHSNHFKERTQAKRNLCATFSQMRNIPVANWQASAPSHAAYLNVTFHLISISHVERGATQDTRLFSNTLSVSVSHLLFLIRRCGMQPNLCGAGESMSEANY